MLKPDARQPVARSPAKALPPAEANCAAQQARIAELEAELADARATIRELIAGAAAGMAAGDGLVATLAGQVEQLQGELVETEEDLEFATDVAIGQDGTIENLKIALLTQPPLGRH